MGMGPVEGMVVMEELGRGIVLEPLSHALMCGALLSGYADDQTKAKWLPKLCSGEALVVLASQEQGKRYKLDASSCTASAAGGGYQISGAKSLVPAGDQADAFLLSAMCEGELALFLVKKNLSTLSIRTKSVLLFSSMAVWGKRSKRTWKNKPKKRGWTDAIFSVHP